LQKMSNGGRGRKKEICLKSAITGKDMDEFPARDCARGTLGVVMIKGCQKEMIVLQTKESALFESAYFVLRRGKNVTPRGDMLAESNRIIGEGREYLRKRQKGKWILPFVGGFLLGGALALLITLIILL